MRTVTGQCTPAQTGLGQDVRMYHPPPPPPREQTRLETLPSLIPTYVVGNTCNQLVHPVRYCI